MCCFSLCAPAKPMPLYHSTCHGPGPSCCGEVCGAPPASFPQPHGHVRHLLRGPLLLPLGPRYPSSYVRPLPAGPPGAGRPSARSGAAVGCPGGFLPRAAGQAQCHRRAVWLRHGLLPVQPGGDAVGLTGWAAAHDGTDRVRGQGFTVPWHLQASTITVHICHYLKKRWTIMNNVSQYAVKIML